jgi:hypothetical protein
MVSYERIRAATYARSTVMNDDSVLNRFIQGVGDPQCHLLDAGQCEEWFAAEAERQLPTSYNKVRVRVLAFLAFCNRRGWIEGDPMAEVQKRRTQARRRGGRLPCGRQVGRHRLPPALDAQRRLPVAQPVRSDQP